MPTERINIVVTEQGTRVVKRRLAEIGTQGAASAKGVALLRSALLGIGGVAVLGQTIRTIASFEQALSTVKAVSGATELQLLSLRDTARELGATTRYTATQAAEGLVELSRAGFQVSESLESVDDTLLLAQAGNLDLKRAAELTSGAIRAFRLNADQAGRVTDVYALAANSAATDVNQLGEAMKFAAPAAAGLGVSIEETTAALQVLADAGLKASLGGTGLRQVMIALESPAEKTRKILQKAGVSLKDVKISSVGLTKALATLKKAGIDTGEAYEIFGRRAGGAADILINMIPKLQANTEANMEAGGTAREVARIMDDNLNGALLRVKSAFEAVQLSMGELGGSSFLVTVLDSVANSLRFLASHVEIVDGVLGALALTTIPKLLAALVALAPMLSLVAVGAGIGALVAFRHEIRLTQDSATTLGDLGSAALQRIKESGNIVAEFFRTQWGDVSDAFANLEFSVEGMVKFTAIALDRWIGLWRAVINAIHELFKNLGPALKEIMIEIVNDIISTMDSGLRKFYDALGNIPGRLGEPYRRLARQGVIPRLEQTAAGASEELANSVIGGFKRGFEEITVFEDSVNAMFDRADEIAQERLARQAEQIAAGPESLVGPTGVAPTPEQDLDQQVNQFSAGVEAGMTKISEIVNGYGSQVETTLVNAFNSAEDALVSFVTTGKVDFKSLVDSMLSDLTRLLSRQALSGLLNALGSGGTAGGGGLFGTLANSFGGAKAAGGSAVPGQFYVVGEKGPELFAPDVPGQVIPNSAQVAAKPQSDAAAGGVLIINVSSKEEALAAMQSADGKRIVWNFMDEKQRQVT